MGSFYSARSSVIVLKKMSSDQFCKLNLLYKMLNVITKLLFLFFVIIEMVIGGANFDVGGGEAP